MRMVSAVLLCFALPGTARTETVLRVAPGSDGSSFDPMGPAATQTYIQGLVVYDMLFALDEQLNMHPQMVGAEDISADRLTSKSLFESVFHSQAARIGCGLSTA